MEFIKDNMGLVILVVLLLPFVFVFIKACIKAREEHKKLVQELEEPYAEPQIFDYKATVIEKRCGVENHGSVKIPQTHSAYYLTFKTYDGRVLKFNVLEEDYFKIEENQTGTLAIVNDNFYGFCPDE